MTDHKFEPFQKVLVRDSMSCDWTAVFFSHMDEDNFICVGNSYLQCIPYTPETAHLLGTSQPYEPPKPPVEYEWGQKVEVPCSGTGDWEEAVYIHKTLTGEHVCTPRRLNGGLSFYTLIRPIPDDTDTIKCGICGKTINERTAANDVECGPCCPEHYRDDTAAH